MKVMIVLTNGAEYVVDCKEMFQNFFDGVFEFKDDDGKIIGKVGLKHVVAWFVVRGDEE